MTYCIVGAGAAGLTAARHLKARGIPFEVVEREQDVGGIWNAYLPHSPVYHSARFISSKQLTQFPDYPMPAEYPDYPHNTQALAYLRSYAKAFELYEHIRFGTRVDRAQRVGDEGWRVAMAAEEPRTYTGLIVASGVHWAPSLPDLPGSFEGESLHSCEYKSPEIFRGRRVLVVGGGNSGCDIAAEASQVAERTHLSVRRGYHFIPKYAFGRPIDQVGELGLKLGLPLRIRRALNGLVLRTVVGNPRRYGLPRPDHRLLESHPIVNSQILVALRRGDVRAKPDVTALDGRRVRFKDGSSEAIDVIVYATGYRVAYPFLDAGELNSSDGRPDFYLHLFHPSRDDLFVLGLLQPDSGVWQLMDLQARAVAGYVGALRRGGPSIAKVRAMKRGPPPDLSGGIRYLKSERHRYEVEHSTYARAVRRVIRVLES